MENETQKKVKDVKTTINYALTELMKTVTLLVRPQLTFTKRIKRENAAFLRETIAIYT